MPLDQTNCNICLEKEQNLRNTEENDKDDIKFTAKLSFCIPELDWSSNSYLLCPRCADKLSLIYDFRRLCLKSFGYIGNGGLNEKFSSLSRNLVEFSDEDQNKSPFNSDEETQNPSNKKQFKTNPLRIFSRKIPTHKKQSQKNSTDDKNEDGIKENEVKNVKELTCFNCEQNFKDKDVLIEHLNKEHNNNTSNTLKLNVEIQNSAVDKEILEIKDGPGKKSKENASKQLEKQIYKCGICSAVFSRKYLLQRHVTNVHATEKRHNCDICGQKFASPVYLSAHKRYHSGDRPHICSVCGKSFITTSELYHHRKIHANKRSYKCDKCPKAFNTSSDLHKHNICVHMDRSKWKYVCVYCNKRFPLKTNMDTHVKTHTGERNFPCHLCERRFINNSVLLRHIATHSNVRSFHCNVCSQDYKYQKSLDIHMTKSHGIGNAKIPQKVKKYICHMCPKSYYANSNLQKHLRSHTGERPYGCNVCEKKFLDQSHLNQHLKTVHCIALGISNN
ncbi:hypothetical protein Trydic_g20409 [Trypoxylus dichotomus]